MILSDTMNTVPAGGTRPPFGLLDRWPVILLVCFAAIVPLLLVSFPPLVDLYGHLGRYAVQTDLANRPELQPFYTYEWKLIGNLGGDILVQALHRVLGLETAVHFVVVLAQFLGALGLLLIAREVHGRVTPFAIAAIPLLYGYPFNYGFINYALSMALAMLAFVVWLRLHRAQRTGAARLWLAVGGAAIWVCHTFGWAFLGLMAGSAMLAEVFAARLRPVAAARRIVGACWPLLMPIIPMVIWRAEATGAAMSGWSLDFKLFWLRSPLRTEWYSLDVGALAVITALLVWALFSRTVRYDPRLGVAAVLCLAFYFILPNRVFGSAFADMRLLPYAFALGLVAIGPVRLGATALRVAGGIALALFAGRMAVTSAAYIKQDRIIQAELTALEPMPMGARIAFFVVKRCWNPWAVPVLDHAVGAAIARRNAFVNDQWQQPGVNPMRVRYPAAGPFYRDPSHLTQREDCSHRLRPKLSESLAKLPLGAFTHVWIIGDITRPVSVPAGLVPVPYGGAGLLYKVTPAR